MDLIRRKVEDLVVTEANLRKAAGFEFRSNHEAESWIRLQTATVDVELGRCTGWAEAISDAVDLERYLGVPHYAEELEKQAEDVAREAIILAALARLLKGEDDEPVRTE